MMSFWQGKKVFITGHTGFKGSWLALWLQALGARTAGYALAQHAQPNMFALTHAAKAKGMVSTIGDIRDYRRLSSAMKRFRPDIVFHLAAQPLVRASYREPVRTFDVNVIGTANVLEAVRSIDTVKAVIVVTSDKCYENREWIWPYRETDRLGGHDPYSASKACAELVTDSFRRSIYTGSSIACSTVRSGNVIGGGDWAEDRLIPDCVRSLLKGEAPLVRNPNAIRPWQHVLNSLSGYMLLAEKMFVEGRQWAEAWNFGPGPHRLLSSGEVALELLACWGEDARLFVPAMAGSSGEEQRHAGGSASKEQPHEAGRLALDCSKAESRLGWTPRLTIREAIRWTAEWYKAYAAGADMRETTLEQIDRFERLPSSFQVKEGDE